MGLWANMCLSGEKPPVNVDTGNHGRGDMDDIKQTLLVDRQSAYARLRGGFPVTLAGATYWAALAALSQQVSTEIWHYAALFGSGAIFPLALLYARIFRNDFMKDTSATSSLIAPAFIGMLLFWPMAIAALWRAPDLFPMVLAIGMSIHWPVIGWSYGRTAIFSAHSIIRAIVVFAIWWRYPEQQLLLIPSAVAIIYLVTIFVIVIDSGLVRNRLNRPAQ